jgi:hypothetical protein
MLNTHQRTGCSGKTSSTSGAALSAMRRAPQLGQQPRRLQLNATRCGTATAIADAQEVVLEAAALEVVLELRFDIRRQVRALRRQMRLERLELLLDELAEERALRAVAFVYKRTNPRARFPASRQRQHDRILAGSCGVSNYRARQLSARSLPATGCHDGRAWPESLWRGRSKHGRE